MKPARLGASLVLSLCAIFICIFPMISSSTGPSPSTVQLISIGNCYENLTCYHVRVDCEGLNPREAEVRAFHVNGSKGSVIFLGGGFGRAFYSGGGESTLTIETLREEGYETYEISWIGHRGWGTNNSGAGFKALTCGFATLARWIVAEIADNTEIAGATGHSGGANQIAYGLAVHGLDEVLDVVVLTGGPARSDLVALCRVNSTGVSRLVDYVMGWYQNGSYCENCEFLEWVERDLYAESIVSPLENETRNYNYTNTRVGFVNGELDVYAVNGRLFYDTISCEKTWIEIAGLGHGVPGDPEGALKIREYLLDGLAATAGIPENILPFILILLLFIRPRYQDGWGQT